MFVIGFLSIDRIAICITGLLKAIDMSDYFLCKTEFEYEGDAPQKKTGSF